MQGLLGDNYFLQEAPSQMFDKVLITSLSIYG